MKKLILLSFFIILVSCEKSVNYKKVMHVSETYKVSMVAVGDNLIHKTIYDSVRTNQNYDFKPIYQEIKPMIKEHDLAFINQETILGGKEIGLSTYPCFNSPYEVGDALVDAGFNLISLANNHTLDRGEKAVHNSIEYWKKQKVIYSGSERSQESKRVKTFEKNNINFAFVAYTYGTNGIPIPEGKEYLVNVYDKETVQEDITRVREEVDVIIVSMHWGDEYISEPNESQKSNAQYLASLGVDIIIGHHPHVIQPVEIIENDEHLTYVVYSLGNFLSDQIGIDRLIGLVFRLDIIKTNEDGVNKIYYINPKTKLLYRHKDNGKFLIKMFDVIDEGILPNFEFYYQKKRAIIQRYHTDIEV